MTKGTCSCEYPKVKFYLLLNVAPEAYCAKCLKDLNDAHREALLSVYNWGKQDGEHIARRRMLEALGIKP